MPAESQAPLTTVLARRPIPWAHLQHNGVNAGDTVCLYRNVATNDLTVEVLRGAGLPPLPPGTNGTEAAAAAAAAAALGPQPQPQEPVPTFASGQLPGLAWTLGPRGGKRTGGPAACGPGCSPAPAEEDDEYWAAGADDGSDGDYSPTAKGRGGKRSAAAAKGPMAVRRALNKQRSGSSDGSDQVGRGKQRWQGLLHGSLPGVRWLPFCKQAHPHCKPLALTSLPVVRCCPGGHLHRQADGSL